MRFDLRGHGVLAIVLDIEGTTTPIAFVHEVLFRFARAHLRESLDQLGEDALREPLRRLRAEWRDDVARGEAAPAWPKDQGPGTKDQNAAVAAYVEWLMDRDRKSPGLKLLQGQIWERGYRAGTLRGEVFADVPAALRRWRDADIPVAIYSSGSQLAQRLLFGSTAQGDLTTLVSRFFDTDVGAKTSAESYRQIARQLICPIDRLLFVSDVTAELDAAREAGCQALLCVRPGHEPEAGGNIPVIESFDEIA